MIMRAIQRLAGAALAAGMVMLVLGGQRLPAAVAQAPTGAWSNPTVLSRGLSFGWFPDISVDSSGRVHVIWEAVVATLGQELRPYRTVVMHTARLDGQWTPPNDVLAPADLPQGFIYRAVLAAGPDDQVYLAYSQDGVAVMRAPGGAATSAAHWTSPRGIASGVVYMSDLAIGPDGAAHLVWDQLVETESREVSGERAYRSDLMYASSPAQGQHWSWARNLTLSAEGVYGPHIEVDSSGAILVSWNQGWTRPNEAGAPQQGMLITSTDNGQTWSTPVVFSRPSKSNAQFTASSNGRGGVLAVWRTTTNNRLYYAWSSDGGRSWTSYARIPGLLARAWDWTRFDDFALVSDSAGTFHLIAVGRRNVDPDRESDGLYHLAWDGRAWSEPQVIHRGPDHAEYPQIAVAHGNQLHVTWYTRDQYYTDGGLFRIWYSHSQTSAPALAPLPTPTPSPEPAPTATPTSVPTPTPLALSAVDAPFLEPGAIYTETDEVIVLLASLLPAALIAALVIAVARLRR